MPLPTRNILVFSLFLLIAQSCAEEKQDTLFTLREDSGVLFANDLLYTEEFNPYTYRNFYNGAGVAIGDINNDGLQDIYFSGNQVDNKLYLNRGNWEFEDITERAGVACQGAWSSGVNLVDLNADGLLDLYVSKAGLPEGGVRHNELFINNGDLTFTERSEQYGLDFTGLGIHSAFFDYDRDGDLDCYLLNNSMRSVAGFNLSQGARDTPTDSGNKLLRNDNGVFVDVSTAAGIYTSAIGFGLGITISDLNNDTWPDLYISNDFFEKDYLYINNQDGTFSEQGDMYLQNNSLGSMGADAGDLDNDGRTDLMVTEMLPSTIASRKTNAIYESWKKYNLAVSKGYGHQQPRNVLQRNMGDGTFLEVGRMAGVEATDWSWSSLLVDLDNDGLKDLFITNGVYKDLLDRDYLTFMANDSRVKNLIQTEQYALKSLIDTMPSRVVHNFVFKNKGDFSFRDMTSEWGADQPLFSNGCAYGDLDNDGDLDLVISNVNAPASILENRSDKSANSNITIRLQGSGANLYAIGSKVMVYHGDTVQMQELYPSRGFQSAVSSDLVFGLGRSSEVDSVRVLWPDGSVDTHKVDINRVNTLKKVSSKAAKNPILAHSSTSIRPSMPERFPYRHQENKFNQFDRERILHKMNTDEGPALVVCDFNGDGTYDLFIGGAKGQSSIMYLSDGENYREIEAPFLGEIKSEVVAAHAFDSDGDGDMDLYVAHGGSAGSQYSTELDDVLYINNGLGEMSLFPFSFQFPRHSSTGAVAIYDYDNDGDEDIFVGERNSHLPYGTAGSGYILINEGDNRYRILQPDLFSDLGMITDAKWIDINDDGRHDLIIVGEFMGIRPFLNTGEEFVDYAAQCGLENTKGIWNTIQVADVDHDGDMDFMVGNSGLNIGLSVDHFLCINDFDKNGSQDAVLCISDGGRDVPVLDMDELISQVPGVKKQFVYYADYAKLTMSDIFGTQAVRDAQRLDIDVLDSRLYLNQGGKFAMIALPAEVQYSSIHSITLIDQSATRPMMLVLGGNNYNIKPQYGREDASKGWLVSGYMDGKVPIYDSVQMLGVEGEIRDIKIHEGKILVGVNDGTIKELVLIE